MSQWNKQVLKVLMITHCLLTYSDNLFGKDIYSREKQASLNGQVVYPYKSFLSQVSTQKKHDMKLWEAVINTPFKYSSTKPGQFHFELILLGNSTGQGKQKNRERIYLRHVFEYDGKQTAVFTSRNDNLFFRLFYKDKMYGLIPEAEWKLRKNNRWGYFIDGDRKPDYYDTEAMPKNQNSVVSLDLSSLLRAKKDIESCVWDMTSRSLIAKSSSGIKMQLKFRSPDDALKYGNHVGEYRLEYKNNVECIRAFQTKPSNTTRLSLKKLDFIKDALNASEADANQRFHVFDMIALDAQAASILLWKQVSNFPSLGIGINKRDNQNEPPDYKNLNTRQRLFVLVYARLLEEIAAGKIDSNWSKYKLFSDKYKMNDIDYFQNMVRQFRDMSYWTVEKASKDGVYPSDPAMIWREIEAEFGPLDSTVLMSDAIKRMNESKLNHDNKLNLLDAILHCGQHPSILNQTDLLHSENIPAVYEAVINSHWKLPVREIHTKACLDELADIKSSINSENILIETLVRLDQAELIPDVKLNRWYESEVVKANKDKRWMKLSMLSEQPSGRLFLLKKLQAKKSKLKISEDIQKILRMRAEVVMATKRFDFITKKQCLKIFDATAENYQSAN